MTQASLLCPPPGRSLMREGLSQGSEASAFRTACTAARRRAAPVSPAPFYRRKAAAYFPLCAALEAKALLSISGRAGGTYAIQVYKQKGRGPVPLPWLCHCGA